MEECSIAPQFLKLSTRQLHSPVTLLPGKKPRHPQADVAHNFPDTSDLLPEMSSFQHHANLCYKFSTSTVDCLNLSQICWRRVFFLFNSAFAKGVLDLELLSTQLWLFRKRSVTEAQIMTSHGAKSDLTKSVDSECQRTGKRRNP